MNKPLFARPLILSLAALALFGCKESDAQESTIRKNLAARLPQLAKIDEVSKTPMPGLYEVRVDGTEIFYTDAKGDFLLNGSLLDTKTRRDLTHERTQKLTAIDFKALPLQDAFVTTRGNGARKVAVFADPNCPYCHRFEADLAKVNNVTVYTFLLPILGEDSMTKSRNIWCAKDRSKTWASWMLNRVAPPAASCDTAALRRNVTFAEKYRITGTPAMVFSNGKRVPGAIPTAQIEKLLAESQ